MRSDSRWGDLQAAIARALGSPRPIPGRRGGRPGRGARAAPPSAVGRADGGGEKGLLLRRPAHHRRRVDGTGARCEVPAPSQPFSPALSPCGPAPTLGHCPGPGVVGCPLGVPRSHPLPLGHH